MMKALKGLAKSSFVRASVGLVVALGATTAIIGGFVTNPLIALCLLTPSALSAGYYGTKGFAERALDVKAQRLGL